MKCFQCQQGEIKTSKENYSWNSKFFGDLTLEDVYVEKCNKCDAVLLPYETALLREQKEAEFLQAYLLSQCHRDSDFQDKFYSSTELAHFLGVSRAAVHKMPKYKTPKYKTLIFHIEIRGEILYFKKSAEKFKETGDGRFDIAAESSETSPLVRITEIIVEGRKKSLYYAKTGESVNYARY